MKSAIDKNSREYLENKMKSARHSLLLVLIFTVVNLVLLLADGNTYFLFSASVPYYLTAFGMGMDAEMGISVFTTTALVISAVILAAYLLCWIFSKRRVGWYVVALVLFTPAKIAFGLVTLPWQLYLVGLGLILVPLVVMELSKLFGIIKHKH